MPEADRFKFVLWSQDDEYLRILEETNRLLATWSQEHERPMVSVSGGKDSTVMLHMVLQHWPGPSVVVWHWDYGAHVMPRRYAREIITIIRSLIGESGAELLMKRRYYTPDTCGMSKMFGAIKYFARVTDRDCSFVGLRAAESGSREKQTKMFEQTDTATGLPVLYPMRQWRAGDLWAYLVSHDLPHHSAYDVFAPMAGGYDSERLRFSVFCFDYAGDGAEAWMPDGVLLWRDRHEMEEI